MHRVQLITFFKCPLLFSLSINQVRRDESTALIGYCVLIVSVAGIKPCGSLRFTVSLSEEHWLILHIVAPSGVCECIGNIPRPHL